jgi:hypothetical protein
MKTTAVAAGMPDPELLAARLGEAGFTASQTVIRTLELEDSHLEGQ